MSFIFDFYKKKIEPLSDKQIAWIFLLFTLIFRVLYSVFVYITHSIPETNLYFELAQQIVNQGKLFYETSHPYYDYAGPVLPLLNAITMMIFGKNYLGLYMVTSLGSALITYYTYRVARTFLNKKISVLIGLWSMLYFFYFYYTPSPGKDIWMSFFVIYLVYMMITLFIQDNFRLPYYIVFCVAFVISFHLDERFFMFTPFVFLFVLHSESEGFRKLKILKTAIFTILVVLLSIPWTIRNYQKYDKIVLISTRTEAISDKAFGYEYRGHEMDEFNEVEGRFYIKENQIDSVILGLITYTDGGWPISAAQVEAMQKGHLPKPLTGIKAWISRMVSMFEPFQLRGRYERTGYFYYKKSFRNNISTFLSYGILFLFSFPGFYYLFSKNKRIFYLFTSIIVIYGLIHMLAIPYTNWRYRLPLDAIFIIVGLFGLSNILHNIPILKSKQNKSIVTF